MNVIVVHLAGEWKTFHRRPMLEALAERAPCGFAVCCVDLPKSPARELLGGRWELPLNRWKRGPVLEQLGPALYLYKPVAPFASPLFHRWKGGRERMRTMMQKDLRQAVNALSGEGRVIGWFYHPRQIEAFGELNYDAIIYERYDDYSRTQTDIEERDRIREKDAEMMANADFVLSTSIELQRVAANQHPRAYYIPNGSDFRLFSTAASKDTPVPSDLSRIRHPRIGHVGVLADFIDYHLIYRTARARPDWSFILIGHFDRSNKDSRVGFEKVLSLTNVHYFGHRPRETLPHYLSGMDILTIPYREESPFSVINPNKLWDYMATGKPVVTTKFCPEIAMNREYVFIANGENGFLRQIEGILGTSELAFNAGRMEWARRNDWTQRADEVWTILRESGGLAERKSAVLPLSGES